MKLQLTLTGTHPMLQHNGRMADPTNQFTRDLKAISGKRKKTDEDLVDIMRIEARGSCWETPEGLLGVPSAAVWRCLFDAAKNFKLGTTVKKALHFDDVVEPLLVDGAKVTCEDFLMHKDHIDYRPVKIMAAKTMRSRPRVPEGWETTHTFELLDDVIDLRNLQPVLETAGRLVGIGDWRPTYGRFTTELF